MQANLCTRNFKSFANAIIFWHRSFSHTKNELLTELQNASVVSSQEIFDVVEATDRKFYSTIDPYSDRSQPIGYGASIAAPYMHASALELLKDHIKADSHILDVGSGSGYMSSCFARLLLAKFGTTATGYVVGIEKVPILVENCLKNIRNDDASLLESKRILIIEGDGQLGCPGHEPFDVIYVGAAAQEMPHELIRQLNPGGRMIIPVGSQDSYQLLLQVDKDASGKLHKKKLLGAQFVPLKDL